MRRSIVPLVVLAGLPVLPATAAAKVKRKAPAITVMSRNLYLGADLGPAVRAASIADAIDAAGTILNDVDASNFPARAKLLAAEVAKAKPDLLGVQEAALWRYQTPADYTATAATTVRYDFLKSLRSELAKRGARYKLAVVQEEFDQELPADTDHSDATGSAALSGADGDGRLTMRDAILVRKGSGVRVTATDKAQYTTQFSVKLGGVVEIKVPRGWVSVDATVKRTRRTRRASFRFVDTHLESFGDPGIRKAQAQELFAAGGPYRTAKQLVAVGDFNSGSAKDHVGPGFTTPGDEGAYNALVGFGLTNLGTRQTCCYPDVFQPLIGTYRFDHTVDHVFAKPRLKQLKAYVTGTDPGVTATPAKLVSSDHGGLVSRLRLK